jgi:hypothetical protein
MHAIDSSWPFGRETCVATSCGASEFGGQAMTTRRVILIRYVILFAQLTLVHPSELAVQA